jgi:carboxylesterase type B
MFNINNKAIAGNFFDNNRGHFTEGSANGHRPEFFMDEDVVLVTINYRLGALGMLRFL